MRLLALTFLATTGLLSADEKPDLSLEDISDQKDPQTATTDALVKP